MKRWMGQDGAVSAEFVGVLPLLLLVALFGWQMLMFTSAADSAATAARNGARASSVGQDVQDTVEETLPPYLRPGQVDVDGPRVEVTVQVPILMRGLSTDAVTLSRSAELPNTG